MADVNSYEPDEMTLTVSIFSVYVLNGIHRGYSNDTVEIQYSEDTVRIQ